MAQKVAILPATMLACMSWMLVGACPLESSPLYAQPATPLPATTSGDQPFALVLGTAQDGGYPQAGCAKECCAPIWSAPTRRRYVSSLAVIDPRSQQRWLIDCTPDFRDQLRLLDGVAPRDHTPMLHGIFLTHAHIGHYTGLMHLGREVMGQNDIAVFAMPRMQYFLQSNGPWSQLVELKQVQLRRLAAGSTIQLNERLTLTPFLVPHRDEFSETVGFKIVGPDRSLLYLPDIDKWERWEVPIEQMVREVDLALLDGTFFSGTEIRRADASTIPHPLVIESLARFQDLPTQQRAKIQFIHLNHTNPLLRKGSREFAQVIEAGLGVAQQGERHGL